MGRGARSSFSPLAAKALFVVAAALVFALPATLGLETVRKKAQDATVPVAQLLGNPSSGPQTDHVAIPVNTPLLAECFGAQCPKDTRLSSPHTCELTAQDFGDQGQFALGIGQPTVVEFYKPTCKHCLALVPIYEKIGMEFQSPKPPGNFAGVRTCRFDAAEKDPVTMAIRARFKIKTFPCIRVFPSQWKFGSKGPTWNETFMGEEYDAHITRTVDTVEDFITASLAKLGEKPAHDANVAAAASQAAQSHWTTVAAGFGSFKESRPAFLKEWNKEVQGCPADEEEEGEEVDEEKTHRAGSHVDLLDGRAEVASASASASSFAAAAAAAAAASPGAGTP